MKFFTIILLSSLCIAFLSGGCDTNEEGLIDKLPGVYSYSSDITGPSDASDSGTLTVSILENNRAEQRVRLTFVEISSVIPSQREYVVDLVIANLDPFLIFFIRSQENPRSEETELISGTGRFEFSVDGQRTLIDGFFDISKNEVTLGYTAAKADSVLLVTLSGVRTDT